MNAVAAAIRQLQPFLNPAQPAAQAAGAGQAAGAAGAGQGAGAAGAAGAAGNPGQARGVQIDMSGKMMHLFPPNTFSGLNPASAPEHFDAFERFIDFHSPHNIMLPADIQRVLNYFLASLIAPARHWFSELRRAHPATLGNSLASIRTAFLRKYNPWGNTEHEWDACWDALKFDLQNDEFAVFKNDVMLLGELLGKTQAQILAKVKSVMPNLIRGFVLKYNTMDEVEETLRDLKPIKGVFDLEHSKKDTTVTDLLLHQVINKLEDIKSQPVPEQLYTHEPMDQNIAGQQVYEQQPVYYQATSQPAPEYQQPPQAVQYVAPGGQPLGQTYVTPGTSASRGARGNYRGRGRGRGYGGNQRGGYSYRDPNNRDAEHTPEAQAGSKGFLSAACRLCYYGKHNPRECERTQTQTSQIAANMQKYDNASTQNNAQGPPLQPGHPGQPHAESQDLRQ